MFLSGNETLLPGNETHPEMKHSSETESQTRFKHRLSSPEILKVLHRIRGKIAHVIAASNCTTSVPTIQKRHL